MRKGVTFVTCPVCEANFPSTALVGGTLPRHRGHEKHGPTCPGSGELPEESMKRNPPLVIFGNPRGRHAPRRMQYADDLSHVIGEVYAIVYRHAKLHDMMVHGFGPYGEAIQLDTLRDGVRITGMNVDDPTGTHAFAITAPSGQRVVTLAHLGDEPLWDDL